MNVNKLTITPLSKGWPGTIIPSPSAESAARLIKERLTCDYYDASGPARALRKIPEALKGFVNPQSKYIPHVKFDMLG